MDATTCNREVYTSEVCSRLQKAQSPVWNPNPLQNNTGTWYFHCSLLNQVSLEILCVKFNCCFWNFGLFLRVVLLMWCSLPASPPPQQMKHITGSTADTFLEYIERNLPEGVAMKVTKVKSKAIRLLRFPSLLLYIYCWCCTTESRETNTVCALLLAL